MTYRVMISADHIANSPRIYDLDDPDQLNLYLEYVLYCADFESIIHLYEGERVVIECIERDDQ